MTARRTAKKAAMPRFVKPELCKLEEAPPTGKGWVHETKFDGYRIQLHVKDHAATLRTRKGLDWTRRFPEIATDADALPDCVADGEICAIGEDGVTNFAALQQAISEEKTAKLVFYLFDLIYADGKDLTRETLRARKDRLKAMLKRSSRRLLYVADTRRDGPAMLKEACKKHEEGIISKREDAPYRGTRSGDWVKAKCRGEQEVVIGGWWGDSRTLRAILVGWFKGGKLIYAGRIGTGFNARNRPPLLRKLNALERKTPPFANTDDIPRTRDVHWVRPELVAEVEYETITRAGLLRQAAYQALREDKPAKSVRAAP